MFGNETRDPTIEQQMLLMQKLREWKDSHPDPDVPVLAFLGRSYTPRQVVTEAEQRTAFGTSLLTFLTTAAGQYETTPEVFIDRAIDANHEAR